MDTINAGRRSVNMRAIRSKDTKPELVVRRVLRTLGHTGYRLHRKDLPGQPDIAFIGRKKAIFVHGCFWHSHNCKEGLRTPQSRIDYWEPKIKGNRDRDARHRLSFEKLGWQILTIWDCEIRSPELGDRLGNFLAAPQFR